MSKTAKGNTLHREVWVTHWDTEAYGPYLSGVSEAPWESDYHAPVTEFADNTRYVLGTVADAAQALLAAIDSKPKEAWASNNETPKWEREVYGPAVIALRQALET